MTFAYKKKASLFLVSQGITLFGSSLVQFAIIWYVTLKTSSGVWVAALTAAAYVPQFMISFFAGVWADRYPKKRLIIFADALIAVATLALALCMPYIKEDEILLIVLITISAIRSFGAGTQAPAVNAAIPQLVPEEKLIKYNGFNATAQSLIQFAAPIAASAALSAWTLREALMIDVLTAIAGISVLCAVTIPFIKAEAQPSAFSEMKAGFGYAKKEQFIGYLLLLFGVFIFLSVPAGFLASLFVGRYYGDSYWYMTLVEVIGFIGMTAGGLLMGIWGGFKNRVKTLVVGIAAFGILAVGMGLVRHFYVYLALMAVYGIALTMVQTATTTLLQEKVVPEMQGRIFGLFGAAYSGFLPLGMMAFGPLADVVPMRFLMIVSGVLLIAMALLAVWNRKFFLFGKNKR